MLQNTGSENNLQSHDPVNMHGTSTNFQYKFLKSKTFTFVCGGDSNNFSKVVHVEGNQFCCNSISNHPRS